MKNLFGDEVSDVEPKKITGIYKKKKHEMCYRKLSDNPRQCKNCEYSMKTYSNTDIGYWKCRLIGLSQSVATDIHAKGCCRKHQYSSEDK